MDDLFRQQSEWQKSRALLSWSEKLEMAAMLREAALALRKLPPPASSIDRQPEPRRNPK